MPDWVERLKRLDDNTYLFFGRRGSGKTTIRMQMMVPSGPSRSVQSPADALCK